MVAPIGPVAATAATAPTRLVAPAAPATDPATAGGFGELLGGGLQSVSNLEFTADAAIQDMATGGPTSIEDVMIATSQAQLGIDMLARVRDRALEAYQEIMRMPL